MDTPASRLKKGFKAHGLTAVSVGKSLGVTHQLIVRILKGDTPGMKHMPTFAKMLNCSVEWLMNGTGDPPTWAQSVAAPAPDPFEHIVVSRLAAIDAALTAQRNQLDALLAAIIARPCFDPPPDPPLRLVRPSAVKSKETTAK